MKKTALIKTSLREIRQSTTRFLSIMGIIFLGVMVFVGLKATGPDMIKTANNYYQKEQLPDARIISTMGLEKKDLTTLQSLKDVETVVPRYTIDATIGPQNNAVKLFGYRKNQAGSVNYQVVDGRLPKQTNEIALDTLAKTRYDYKMGDKITLNDVAIKEKGLTQTHFTVVGFINSAEYIDNTSRGTTTVGSGTLNFFGVVSEKARGRRAEARRAGGVRDQVRMAVDEPREQAATTPVVRAFWRVTTRLGNFRDPPALDGDRRMLQHDARIGVDRPHIPDTPPVHAASEVERASVAGLR